jgi:hypothetical protein
MLKETLSMEKFLYLEKFISKSLIPVPRLSLENEGYGIDKREVNNEFGYTSIEKSAGPYSPDLNVPRTNALE